MKNLAFICVLFNTPWLEIDRLSQEVLSIGAEPFFIDNSNTNKGYAEGINKALRKALQSDNFEYFIIANPDISLKKLDSQHLLDVMNHFDVGGYAMDQQRVIYYGGELDKRRMSGGLITSKPEKRFVSCDFVSGSLMIIKREVIGKIGLFDESYGMYYEDVDYCIRAQKAGFKVGIDSDLTYEHFEQSVTNKKKDYYLATNHWKTLWKYGSWQQKLYELIRLPKTIYEYFS